MPRTTKIANVGNSEIRTGTPGKGEKKGGGGGGECGYLMFNIGRTRFFSCASVADEQAISNSSRMAAFSRMLTRFETACLCQKMS
jgi:hypothetical protein